MVAGGEDVDFAVLIAMPDGAYCVYDVLCGMAVAFGEFGVDDYVHFSVQSAQRQCAQSKSGFLCVMAGVFGCDSGGGLHGTLLSRKMNETETKDLEKVFQKTVLSYFYHNTSFPASFFEKSNEDSCPMFSLLRQRFFL